jgi:DNA adenine methylase
MLIESPRRPVLRWHGGKWMIANWIISHLPQHTIYVEPFGGAASVLLKKPRAKSEIYNDLDDDVVNLFRVLRDPLTAQRLISMIRLTPWSRKEFFASYETSDDSIEQARRTIVRCFMGFGTTGMTKQGTGFRGRAERENSTGPLDFVNYPEHLHAAVTRLRGVIIESRPAVDLIKAQDSEETLFYCDPPYLRDTRTSYRSGRHYRHEMNDSDHRKLGQILKLVKGMVVISGYHSSLYDQDLFRDWKCVERNATVDGGGKRIECLWLNPAAADRLSGD